MDITKKALASKYKCSTDIVRIITARAEFEKFRIGASSKYDLLDVPEMHKRFSECLNTQLFKRKHRLLCY